MENKQENEIENSKSAIKVSSEGKRFEVSGSEKFTERMFDRLKEILSLPKNTEKSNIGKYGPEFFTNKIYTKLFTPIRVPIFLFFLFFCLVDLFWIKFNITLLLPYWSQEIFNSLTTKMIYLLLSLGALASVFLTISIDIIRKKSNHREATAIFSNLVKYITYPFFIVIIIEVILFLRDAGLYKNILFSVFLFFVYLTISSFYTTIRMAQILVDEAFGLDSGNV